MHLGKKGERMMYLLPRQFGVALAGAKSVLRYNRQRVARATGRSGVQRRVEGAGADRR